MRAELAQVSTVAKTVPVVKDNHAGKEEQLKVELTAAYGQQKRVKMQCEDQAVKIEKLRRLVWEMNRKTPPSYSLMRAYEHQWYILFSLVGIEGTGQQLSQNSFERLWKIAGLDDNAQNLVAEMILRGGILVPELAKKMFSLFGHLGYRSLKYWLQLENQLHERRMGDKPVELERTVRLVNFDDSTLHYAATLDGPQQVAWRKLLVQFQEDLAKVAPLRQSLTYSYEREEFAQKGELGISHYLHASSMLWIQLKELLAELDRGIVCPFPSLVQIQLTVPPPGFARPPWANQLAIPVEGSRRTRKYLGNYACLFESPEAQDAGIPSWDAMLWITEHYQSARAEETPRDLLYHKKVGPDWTKEAPAAIQAIGVYCNLAPRRLLWAPNATIDSREYNWPIIEGRFDTPFECTTAYTLFFETHKTHRDPVCFRAAIFARFLALVCMTHCICINVNKYESKHPEFLINMKMRFLPTRHLRMLEIMCVTHFIYSGSLCFINEFREGRKKAYDKWLQDRQTKDPTLIDNDLELRREVDKLRRKGLLY